MSVQPLTTLTGLECLFLDRAQLTPNLQHFAHFSRLQHLALTTNGTLVCSFSLNCALLYCCQPQGVACLGL